MCNLKGDSKSGQREESMHIGRVMFVVYTVFRDHPLDSPRC